MNDNSQRQDTEHRSIRLRGVRVNNLKSIDLDIPHGQMVAFCGLSGSGKTSLALDTLFAEGQRRYIECFSPYTRQFLDQLEKPEADLIDGIPPAIAVTASRQSENARSTIGSVTEIVEFLRLLFARTSQLVCHQCDSPVDRSSPQQIIGNLNARAGNQKFMIAFGVSWENQDQFQSLVSDIKRNGFRRLMVDGKILTVEDFQFDDTLKLNVNQGLVIVDRLKTGSEDTSRCIQSLETAFFYGHGTIAILIQSDSGPLVVNGNGFDRLDFSDRLTCGQCHIEYPEPDAALFSFNSVKGACPECEGFGTVHFLDMQKIVSDPSRSLRDGAIVPWNSPAYRHELDELIQVAPFHGVDLDVPFSELGQSDIDFLWSGDRDRDFGGLNGFFAWLEKRKYKMHLRIFLARWRSYRQCPSCHGCRLNPTALSFRIADRNFSQWMERPIVQVARDLDQLSGQLANQSAEVTRLIKQLTNRLAYLEQIGVGYLALGRQLRTLSSGERQRVALTRALGSKLVNLLYVLDEPSAGLHAENVQSLLPRIHELNQRNNTVVVVDHNLDVIRAAQRVVEIGPAAGNQGGRIMFDGTPDELAGHGQTITADFLADRRGGSFSSSRRDSGRGRIQIAGACGNNLKRLTVNFPLDLLCVVSGVSGAGKSTLVRHTLAPALQNRIDPGAQPKPVLPMGKLHGGDRFEQIVVIDQSALPKTSRSNPATYVKAWDEIRKVFSETPDAQAAGLKPGAFSFNVQGGRCDHCDGDGFIRIDMQFMADVLRRCEQCQGTRFKPEVGRVKYRTKNVSDVLSMTAQQAFTFFRGHRKVQARLKLLSDVGLGYVQIGQPVSTLSIGEAQRLKLAAFLGKGSTKRTLFIMDQPTTGLHMADVVKLIDCFDALIDVGHSLIVIEHHLLMLAHADHIIDIGPGPASQGGTLVAQGTPEQICEVKQSVTGRHLKPLLQQVV